MPAASASPRTRSRPAGACWFPASLAGACFPTYAVNPGTGAVPALSPLVSAVIGIAAGIVLIRWPISGTVSLTLVLIAFFIIEGIVTLMYAFEHRAQLSGRWGWMLASGIVDLILAGIIFAGLPETATWALGLLVGINLLFGGTAMIGMALAARNAA